DDLVTGVQTCALPIFFVSMAASAKIIDLRKLLAERFPHPAVTTATRLFTDLPFLDQPTGGGLPRRAITELISPRTSAGSASLIRSEERRVGEECRSGL